MQAIPPQNRDEAVRNTLEAKLSVARLRARHATTKKHRDAESALAAKFARQLDELGPAPRQEGPE